MPWSTWKRFLQKQKTGEKSFFLRKRLAIIDVRWLGGDTREEYSLAGLPIKLVLGATYFRSSKVGEAAVFFPQVVMTSEQEGSRSSHPMIVPNTKRNPNNTKTDQWPILGVFTGLPRPYHNNMPCQGSTCARLVQKKRTEKKNLRKRLTIIIDFLKACGRWGHVFAYFTRASI